MKRILTLILLSALLLCGCQMRTVDQMYVPPKRSDDYNSLQTVISQSMAGMEYSAPISGDNQQIVQMADLNGDDVMECLLFAKGGDNLPMHIMVFSMVDEEYVHTQTIDLPGSAFDKVEYALIDDQAGMEIIVGTQVSDQVSRSVSVYSFATGEAEQLVTEDYVTFLTVDLTDSGKKELFVIRAGSNDLDRGVVELFSFQDGVIQRSLELNLSETADNLKRILIGQLHGGKTAVYVASAVDEDTLITDVYAIVNGGFTNVSLSNESGTSVKTMRNYFVYADDMDSDGIMELPSLIPMRSIDKTWYGYDQNLIRWYSMTPDGEEIDKLYTYHHFIGGWYLQIEDSIAPNVSVVDLGNVCDFYVWEEGSPVKVMSVHTMTGQSREAQSTSENRFILHKTESTIYAASLDDDAARFGFTQESVLRNFHMIHEQWYTGET
ncbi:MAG: hypothetical protein IJY91_03210 [Oscillospiraceae bacterium]|nr:hypothetical protein [Oscillospiraceae bacterium]